MQKVKPEALKVLRQYRGVPVDGTEAASRMREYISGLR